MKGDSSKAGPRLPITLLLAIALGYGWFYFFEYCQSPLAAAPQLDAYEMLATGQSLAEDSIDPEPFYRAMGYPWLLSLGFRMGWPLSSVILFASLAGLLAHWLNAALVGKLSNDVWSSKSAGYLTALIYAINPVALFFAPQVLDITIAIFAALIAFTALMHAGPRSLRWTVIGGLALGISVVMRPHFLFVIPAWLGLLIYLPPPPFSRRFGGYALAATAAIACFPLLQSFAGWRLSGEWHWTPWQGAYNLFVANTPKANGKFFTQSIVLEGRAESVNPARVESIVRYAQETEAEPPFPIQDMNMHWKQRFFELIIEDPGAWVGLLLRKTYYIFNDFEQYNNLTYDFHKDRSFILRWNPLGWGALLVAGMGAMLLVPMRRKTLIGLFLVGGTYALGLLLFYASARFRLPLVTLLSIGVGGLVLIPARIKQGISPRRAGMVAILILLTTGLTFSHFFDANDRSTYIQDALLLGNAAAATGDDLLALKMAEEALTYDATRMDARRLALVSYWNLRALGNSEWQAWGDWNAMEPHLLQGQAFVRPDPPLALAIGTIAWNQGHTDYARNLWSETLGHHPDAVLLDAFLTYAEGTSPDVPSETAQTIAHLIPRERQGVKPTP